MQKFASGKIEPAIERGIKSLAWNLMESKARIGFGDRLKKLPAAVGRLAVENDRFPIRERLFE